MSPTFTLTWVGHFGAKFGEEEVGRSMWKKHVAVVYAKEIVSISSAV